MDDRVAQPDDIPELVERARNGDAESFARLYRHYLTPIYRFLYWRVKNREDADDLAQTVFTKAWNAIPSLQKEGNHFTAWLYTIARNAAMDYWRKKKEVLFDIPEAIEGRMDPAPDTAMDAVERAEGASILRKALGVLNDDQQEIIILRFFEEMSNKEISNITGKTEAAIRQIQCRALKMMRDFCKQRKIL
mgnify:CR=1 FL=1